MKLRFLIFSAVVLFVPSLLSGFEQAKFARILTLYHDNQPGAIFRLLSGDEAASEELILSHELSDEEKAVLLYIYGWSCARSGHIAEAMDVYRHLNTQAADKGISYIELATLRELCYLLNMTGQFEKLESLSHRMMKLEENSDELRVQAEEWGIKLEQELAAADCIGDKTDFIIVETMIAGTLWYRVISGRLYAEVKEARLEAERLNRANDSINGFAVIPVPFGWRIIAGSCKKRENAIILLENKVLKNRR